MKKIARYSISLFGVLLAGSALAGGNDPLPQVPTRTEGKQKMAKYKLTSCKCSSNAVGSGKDAPASEECPKDEILSLVRNESSSGKSPNLRLESEWGSFAVGPFVKDRAFKTPINSYLKEKDSNTINLDGRRVNTHSSHYSNKDGTAEARSSDRFEIAGIPLAGEGSSFAVKFGASGRSGTFRYRASSYGSDSISPADRAKVEAEIDRTLTGSQAKELKEIVFGDGSGPAREAEMSCQLKLVRGPAESAAEEGAEKAGNETAAD